VFTVHLIPTVYVTNYCISFG